MAYVPNNQRLEALCNVYSDLLTEQLLEVARRINNNTNTGAIDCRILNVGDVGYSAYVKISEYGKNVSQNVQAYLPKFIKHIVSTPIIDNAQIFELLVQIDSDASGTNEKIADYIMNDSTVFYNLLGINEKDLN